MAKIYTCLLFFGLIFGQIMGQELSVNPLFSDHMVLQQNTAVSLWGKAAPNTPVLVTTSWGADVRTNSGNLGNWAVLLDTPPAGGPFKIVVSDQTEQISIEDVLIGEVWLCSGQSNMEFPLKGVLPDEPIEGSREAISTANFPQIRMFTVAKNLALLPQEGLKGNWSVCSPETAGDFSATAFFFGRKLHKELDVPIGLINSSWGGTPAESWTALEELQGVPGFEDVESKFEALANHQSEYNVWINQLEQMGLEEFRENYEDLNHAEFIDSGYDDSHWALMELPTWLDGSLANFDGLIWFRKSFELSSVDDNALYNLSLGGIDDEDITFVNGIRVGMTKNWTAERNYLLPPNLLKPGKNVISIRLFDGASNGGVYGGQNFGIYKDGQLVQDLSGDWKYLPSAMLSVDKLYNFSVRHSFTDMPEPPMLINSDLPSGLFNGMIHPLAPYGMKGVIWYQGENNVGRADQYRSLFPALINSWRKKWGKEFSFYFTQIAPFKYSGVDNSESAELRFAQNQTLSLAGTGQVVTLDIGTVANIHPPNKKDVGERLARWALAKDYNRTEVAFSGPVCESAIAIGNQIILDFTIGAESLVAGESGLKEFELVFSDGYAKEAVAKIKGKKIILENKSEKTPVAVRYAWKNGSVASLFNSAGLPASTFYVDIHNKK